MTPSEKKARESDIKIVQDIVKQDERAVVTDYPLYPNTPHWWKRKYGRLALALDQARREGWQSCKEQAKQAMTPVLRDMISISRGRAVDLIENLKYEDSHDEA